MSLLDTQVLDGFAGVCGGVYRGLGRQKLVALVVVCAFWLLGMHTKPTKPMIHAAQISSYSALSPNDQFAFDSPSQRVSLFHTVKAPLYI